MSSRRPQQLELRCAGEIWWWRGPAPFHFVSVPPAQVEEIRAVASSVSYGWGMIPADVRIGGTRFTTSLWPKDGGYVVPIKDAVRAAEDLELGDDVELVLLIPGEGRRR